MDYATYLQNLMANLNPDVQAGMMGGAVQAATRLCYASTHTYFCYTAANDASRLQIWLQTPYPLQGKPAWNLGSLKTSDP
jgi:hypothetical protein